jgi:dTDP-4-dehydrorhamnose reductase
VLAEEARRAGAFLVHYSTDYVFDGAGSAPYREDDAPNPLNVYGRSKLAGERAVQAATDDHLILRTSWVYGARGANFLRTVLRLLDERDELRIVADQAGAPTWSRTIAETTAAVLAGNGLASPRNAGIFHLAAAGRTSWHGFATAIRDALPAPYRQKRITAIRTDEYPTPAARPAWSVLDTTRLRETFGVDLPEWNAPLAEVLREHACLREEEIPRG